MPSKRQQRHDQGRHDAPETDQTVDGVDSGEEEEYEPVLKQRRKSSAKPSEFVGVSWNKKRRKWYAEIYHDGKKQHLGCFDDEQEAARAFDTAGRRLRGEVAHGGRAGTNQVRLNFPTEGEVKRAKDRGALLTEEETAAAAASERHGSSEFVGVSWNKKNRKWVAVLNYDRKAQHLGLFEDEQEAALAVDAAARRMRGEDAHGGRAGTQWLRLNFPTEEEVKRAKERGALLTKEEKTAAAVASKRHGPSAFVGVTWEKRNRNWCARIKHDGKHLYLGRFDDERVAARAFDTAARLRRGDGAHGGLSGTQWNRLNFPTEEEVKRARERGALLTAEDKRVVAAVASELQGPSAFVGVSWDTKGRKWQAKIMHDRKQHVLGHFDDERVAARAFDTAARRLRGDDAHGGRAGRNWLRLNFPSKREAGRAQTLGMTQPEQKKRKPAAKKAPAKKKEAVVESESEDDVVEVAAPARTSGRVRAKVDYAKLADESEAESEEEARIC